MDEVHAVAMSGMKWEVGNGSSIYFGRMCGLEIRSCVMSSQDSIVSPNKNTD